MTGLVHDALNYGYSAIAPSVFREALRRWTESLQAVSGRIEANSFVDVGAGKGRAILLSAEQSFRMVIGVELNPDLAGIARRNVGRSFERSKARIRVVQEDAANFRWPRGPLLVYLYNPFDCSLLLSRSQQIWRLRAIPAGGPVDLLYVNPTCAHVLTAKKFFQAPVGPQKIIMDAADHKR